MTFPVPYSAASQVALLRRRLADLSGLAAHIDPADLPAEALPGLDQLQEVIAGLLPILSARASPSSAAPEGLRPTTDLGALLLDLEARWSPRALRQGLGFAVAHPQAMPAGTSLPLNAGIVERALSIALDRAITVSKGGTIRLVAERLAGGGLVLTVCDTGPNDVVAARTDLSQMTLIARSLGARLSITLAPAGSGLATAFLFPDLLWAPPRIDPVTVKSQSAQDEDAPVLDPVVLEALFEMTGPDARSTLLTRIAQDLTRANTDLAEAASTLDLAGLRAGTHVLVALAGTIGATALSEASRLANAAAHRGGVAACVAAVPDISAMIDDALQAVAALSQHNTETRSEEAS